MPLYTSPDDYLFNLQTCRPSDAKREWRKMIKEKWNNECAYCGHKENLTIDHVVPRSKGGGDFVTNVICSCKSCNNAKGRTDVMEWYEKQDFFTEARKNAILEWTSAKKNTALYKYKPRKNIAY